jgi:hypothetical protein
LTWLDLFILWIVAVSLASVCLLVVERFSGHTALIIGTVLSGLVLIFLRPQLVPIQKISKCLLLIILVAVCCRLQPYIWIMGWQDPGTYVNMAAHYERHGSTFIKDSFRERLSGEERKYYDSIVLDDLYQGLPEKEQQYGPYPRVTTETQARFDQQQLLGYTSHVPGVYLKNLADSEYVFQFYPIHPLWMAIFSSLFGEANGVYSLLFFALLTIAMFYRLAKVLSGGNEKVGLLAAGLLAINPLHAFFSKFPVTEVCFLFFTVSGFYYLAAYARDREAGESGTNWLLPLSVLLFFCAFFTRYSGFLYLPFFYLMAVALFIVRGEGWLYTRKIFLQYCVAIISAYALSVCYGLTYSFPYTMEGFGSTFGKTAVRHWQLTLPAAVAIFVVLPLAVRNGLSQYINNLQGGLSHNFRRIVVAGMFTVLTAAAAIACTRYLMKGKDAFLTSTGVIAVSYLTPFAFILLILVFVSLRRDEDTPVSHIWLALFITLFWGVYALGVNTLPYQYYYARYLLSEVVPFSLLFVALHLGRMVDMPGKKGWAYLAIAAIVVYSFYFTACQFKGREADGAYVGLKKVAERVQKNDILFIPFEDFKLLTPLKFFFDLNAFRVEEAVIKEKAGNALAAANNGYVLAKSPVVKKGLKLVEVIDYRQGEFEHALHIPTNFAYIDQTKLYLYQIDKQVF